MSRSRKVQKGIDNPVILTDEQLLSLNTISGTIGIVMGSSTITTKKMETFPIDNIHLPLFKDIKYINGDLIVDIKNRDNEVLYFISNKINNEGIDNVIKFFESKKFADSYELLFSDEAYNSAKEDLQDELAHYHVPPKVNNGMYQCPKCKSHKTISSSSQRRSADEGETVKVKCYESGCGHSWQFNS